MRAIKERIMNKEREKEKKILTYRIIYKTKPVQKTRNSHSNGSISWPEPKAFISRFSLSSSRVQVANCPPFLIKVYWT